MTVLRCRAARSGGGRDDDVDVDMDIGRPTVSWTAAALEGLLPSSEPNVGAGEAVRGVRVERILSRSRGSF
jgi:hypothetical protein